MGGTICGDEARVFIGEFQETWKSDNAPRFAKYPELIRGSLRVNANYSGKTAIIHFTVVFGPNAKPDSMIISTGDVFWGTKEQAVFSTPFSLALRPKCCFSPIWWS